MSKDLAVVNPGTLMTQATDVAGVCSEIVKRTALGIQGRKYVRVEGWQSIAAAYGCVASSKAVERVQGGVKAVGELRRVSDGALVATAEGFVGEDEPMWFGGEVRGKTLPKRPDFAIQAMAQTRAISRVCRSAFAFVVVLIDGNLSTTPAEEMAGVVHDVDSTEEIGKASANDALISPDQVIALEDELKKHGRDPKQLIANINREGKKEKPPRAAIERLVQIRVQDYADCMGYARGQ